MSRRQNLLEFQQLLARRLNDAPERGTVNALLGISLGSESWLLKLTDIAEVVPCPPIESVPWTKPWFRGAVNLRGQVYSVVDLAAFVGGAMVPDSRSARLLLINRSVVRGCALLVDKVLGMRNPAAFRTAAGSTDPQAWIKSHLIDEESASWRELDLRQLTTHPTYLDVTM